MLLFFSFFKAIIIVIVLLVSGVQQNESVIHTHNICSLFKRFFSHIGHYKSVDLFSI